MHEWRGAGGRGRKGGGQGTLPPPAPITAGGLFHIGNPMYCVPKSQKKALSAGFYIGFPLYVSPQG